MNKLIEYDPKTDSVLELEIQNNITDILSKYSSNKATNKNISEDIYNYLIKTHFSIPHSMFKFKNLTLIGSGGFGKVFSGVHYLDKNIYAIKCIKVSENLDKFNETRKEISLLSRLNHTNIIRYYNSWIDIISPLDSQHILLLTENKDTELKQDKDLGLFLFIQMEKMDLNLKQYLTLIKTSLSTKKMIILQILAGVTYLHNQNIIHCDLKPDNILIEKDSINIKITDFGLSTFIGFSNLDYKYYGSYIYTPPEMTADDFNPTFATDIYSLGVIFFEIMNSFKTDMEKIIKITKFKDGIIKTDTIIDKMIDVDPEKRPNLQKIAEYLSQKI